MIKGSQKPKQEGLILSWRLQLGPVCLLAFRVLYCTHPSAPLLLTPQHLSCSSAKLPLWRCQDVFSTRLGVWTQISYYYFQLSHSYALRSAVWNAKCACKPKKNPQNVERIVPMNSSSTTILICVQYGALRACCICSTCQSSLASPGKNHVSNPIDFLWHDAL